MNDIVYVVKEALDHENLRYSLRSLEHLPHGRVVLVGDRPSWAQNVEHIPTRQDASKYENSTANLLTACLQDHLTETIYYFNDDFFILKRMEELPVYRREKVRRVIDHYRQRYPEGSRWIRGMELTYELLVKSGVMEPISYEVHAPMPIHRRSMLDAVRWASHAGIIALHKRTLYGNRYIEDAVMAPAYRGIHDFKLVHRTERIPPDWPLVSTSAIAFRSGRAGEDIRLRFPKRSRYEKL